MKASAIRRADRAKLIANKQTSRSRNLDRGLISHRCCSAGASAYFLGGGVIYTRMHGAC